MIQVIAGQTVYQALNKIFIKKNVPWFKCDLYYVGDYQSIDPQMDAQFLGSKEICLIERCLFVISLVPISINLCVKSNLKKSINSTIQPILEYYQIQTNTCVIHLNSGNFSINLKDPCSCIDNQHLLIVNKHQNMLLSHTELDKYTNISLSDFLPPNFQDFQLKFDELGVLKKYITNSNKNASSSSTNVPSSPLLSNISQTNLLNNNNNNSNINNNNISEQQQLDHLDSIAQNCTTQTTNKTSLILQSVGEDQ
jgi:hypothetical protein